MGGGAKSIQVKTSFLSIQSILSILNYRSEISKFDDIAVQIQDFVS